MISPMKLAMNVDLGKSATVPCNGCSLCCRRDAVMLFPEHGDDVASYETFGVTPPGTTVEVHILKKSADGNCIYLGERGCTIYERRPMICRSFDCRKWFRNHTRTERRYLVKRGLADKKIFDRGLALLSTLSD